MLTIVGQSFRQCRRRVAESGSVAFGADITNDSPDVGAGGPSSPARRLGRHGADTVVGQNPPFGPPGVRLGAAAPLSRF
ncbi:hypothetical protein AB0H28_16435 [Micromonospora sp. NPDC050980]|uniref:hypothetical protein n=1 Tax=Micromonospora sp. NPDC050980 TaxID=3155161 RepID=UPI0033D86E5C